mgnify:CR=1 FL=1
MQSLESAVFGLGVELGGGDAGVSEQFLQFADTCPSGEHVRGEAVSECVRADVAGDARASGVFLDQFPEGDSGELVAAAGEEQPRGLTGVGQSRAFGIEVVGESGLDGGAGWILAPVGAARLNPNPTLHVQ